MSDASKLLEQLNKAKEEKLKKATQPIRIAQAKKDMLHFARWIFEEVYEVVFLESWYHELICKVLMAVLRGEVTRLIINIPPGYGKTEFAVKLFVSWALGKYQDMRFMYVSYADDLATETPAETKIIIASEAYKKVFGEKKMLKSADQKWYINKNGTKGGGMFSTTIGGVITGFHADVLIIDDPMKAEERNLLSAREAVKNFYKGSARSRLKKSNPNAAIIIIMQRLHEDDLVGYLLDEEGNNWTHINLSGIDDKKEITYEFQDFKYIRAINEPLNAKMEDVEALAEAKETMKDQWYSQYLQDPDTIVAGHMSEEVFCTIASWEIPAENKAIFIDPAESEKKSADNRAIGVIGASINKDKIALYTCHGFWYGKWKNEVFVDEIIDVMIKFPDIDVFIEDKGGGIITSQYLKTKIAEVNEELKSEGKLPLSTARIKMFTPPKKMDKNTKIEGATAYWENHQIRFTVGMPGREQIEKEVLAFDPKKDSKQDDCIELVADAVVLTLLKPKKDTKPDNEGVSMGRNDPFSRGFKSKWRI